MNSSSNYSKLDSAEDLHVSEGVNVAESGVVVIHDLNEDQTNTLQNPLLSPQMETSEIDDSDDNDDDDDEDEIELSPSIISVNNNTIRPSKSIEKLKTNDGVFANLNAKPSSDTVVDMPPHQQQPPPPPSPQHPPSYAQVEADAVPPYLPTSVAIFLRSGVQIDEDTVLIGQYPAGQIGTFFACALLTYFFNVFGLLMVVIFSRTHAGLLGSRAGFGVWLVQFGMLMRNKNMGYQYDDSGYMISDQSKGEEDPAGIFISYIVVIIGWFMAFHSTGEYFRVRKVERALLADRNPTISTA